MFLYFGMKCVIWQQNKELWIVVFSYTVNDIRSSCHEIKSIFEKKRHSKYLDSNNNIRSFSRNISRRSYPVILGLIWNKSVYDDSRVCTVHYYIRKCTVFVKKRLVPDRPQNNRADSPHQDDHILLFWGWSGTNQFTTILGCVQYITT